jgi:hypothetical protein
VSAASGRINALLPRVLPMAVGIIIVACGYYGLVQSGVGDYLRLRVEAQSLEARVRTLDETAARGRGLQWPDENQAITLFEARVSKDDRVAEVAERLVRAVAESSTDGKLRRLAMGTAAQPAIGASGQGRPVATTEVEPIDPRWSLFPYTLTQTPVTLSFEASYATITSFFAKLRDLPTAIEIRSVKLTRGLPLMTMELTVFVFRRGDLQPGAGAIVPFGSDSRALQSPGRDVDPANALVPRVILPSRGPGG